MLDGVVGDVFTLNASIVNRFKQIPSIRYGEPQHTNETLKHTKMPIKHFAVRSDRRYVIAHVTHSRWLTAVGIQIHSRWEWFWCHFKCFFRLIFFFFLTKWSIESVRQSIIRRVSASVSWGRDSFVALSLMIVTVMLYDNLTLWHLGIFSTNNGLPVRNWSSVPVCLVFV